MNTFIIIGVIIAFWYFFIRKPKTSSTPNDSKKNQDEATDNATSEKQKEIKPGIFDLTQLHRYNGGLMSQEQRKKFELRLGSEPDLAAWLKKIQNGINLYD